MGSGSSTPAKSDPVGKVKKAVDKVSMVMSQ